MTVQLSRARSTLVALGVVAVMCVGCTGETAPSSLSPFDATICGLSPVARRVPMTLRAAAEASRRSDVEAMAAAAATARADGAKIMTQIRAVSAILHDPGARDAVVTDLTSIALFGDQGGLFFQGDNIPDADGLRQMTAGLIVIDQTVDRLGASMDELGMGTC